MRPSEFQILKMQTAFWNTLFFHPLPHIWRQDTSLLRFTPASFWRKKKTPTHRLVHSSTPSLPLPPSFRQSPISPTLPKHSLTWSKRPLAHHGTVVCQWFFIEMWSPPPALQLATSNTLRRVWVHGWEFWFCKRSDQNVHQWAPGPPVVRPSGLRHRLQSLFVREIGFLS